MCVAVPGLALKLRVATPSPPLDARESTTMALRASTRDMVVTFAARGARSLSSHSNDDGEPATARFPALYAEFSGRAVPDIRWMIRAQFYRPETTALGKRRPCVHQFHRDRSPRSARLRAPQIQRRRPSCRHGVTTAEPLGPARDPRLEPYGRRAFVRATEHHRDAGQVEKEDCDAARGERVGRHVKMGLC
jgi:hypothetical protein